MPIPEKTKPKSYTPWTINNQPKNLKPQTKSQKQKNIKQKKGGKFSFDWAKMTLVLGSLLELLGWLRESFLNDSGRKDSDSPDFPWDRGSQYQWGKNVFDTFLFRTLTLTLWWRRGSQLLLCCVMGTLCLLSWLWMPQRRDSDWRVLLNQL